ncbi:MAG TPA: FkbM family methyltransferase [Candidatus Limnocylindrales bacterium]|nr:FkbM family methyltransferase [Candidatus Limnocylindrales bacterium]
MRRVSVTDAGMRRAWGIARSLAIYHGIPGRQHRMRRFYRQFLRPGDIGFDIGAHVGSRVRAWRRLGVHVVAVEPAPDCLRVLRLLFGRDCEHVTIVPAAVGAKPGTASLKVSTATPTVSTMSNGWLEEVSADASFSHVKWDNQIEVEVTTLDRLIARHGEPAFCKIDVEGFEADVLMGLSKPLRALSFEYLPMAHDATVKVLDLVDNLGPYEYNFSPVETMRLAGERWLDAAGLLRLLDRFRPLGRSGDVYARRIS